MWHPNIYENGEVCISILHPPSNTTQGGELPEERWNPTQSVRTVIMSIISLLNEPNTYSPANVDASIMYRDFIAGTSNKYRDYVQKTIKESKKEAERDDIEIPKDQQDYCQVGKRLSRTSSHNSVLAGASGEKPASAISSKHSNTSSNLYNCYDDYSELTEESSERQSGGSSRAGSGNNSSKSGSDTSLNEKDGPSRGQKIQKIGIDGKNKAHEKADKML